MIDLDTYRKIGDSISTRAALLSEITQKLAEQEKRDAKLYALLLEKAPKELREWVDEEMVLTILLKYGKCSTDIKFRNQYNFKNEDDARQKMKTLGRAWKDVVLIKLDRQAEPGRIGVQFTAVM